MFRFIRQFASQWSGGPSDTERLKQIREARIAFYRTLGEEASAPFTLDSMDENLPKWPTLPTWRRIKNENSTILVTDGLSDPFPGQQKTQSGCGIELLIETTDAVPDEYQTGWLFHVLYQVSQNAVSHGSFRTLLDQHQVGAIEIASIPELSEFQNEGGRIGVFLGMHNAVHHDRIEYPHANALLITAKLLTLEEFQYAMGNGAIGYQILRERFLLQKSDHRSSLKRKSVV